MLPKPRIVHVHDVADLDAFLRTLTELLKRSQYQNIICSDRPVVYQPGAVGLDSILEIHMLIDDETITTFVEGFVRGWCSRTKQEKANRKA